METPFNNLLVFFAIISDYLHILFLCQHDAACRVIARLKKERDEARTLLAQAERQIPMSTASANANAVVSNGKRGSYD